MARTITCILLAAVIVTSSLLYAIPMPALAQGFVIIPHLDSDYKFKVVDHGAEDGFEQPDFDDSEFSVGSAGFGTRSGDCSFNNPIQARTPWPINTDILLRKEFVLPAATGNLQVRVTVDNDVQVFINGMDISGGLLSREGCAELDSFVFNATANAGLNLIAVRARDRGIVSYVDIEVVQLRTSPSLVSPFITAPLDVDGRVGFGEWEVGNRLNFPHGYISVRNDDVRLYLLVNVLEDKKIDPGEFFWLTFDVNRNSRIDPNVDINYRFIADTNEIGYQFYEGAGKWTELRSDTRSSVGTEYDCFIADGTKETFLGITTDCSRHRVWEIGIDLPEIRARPGDFVQMGLRVHSDEPDFTDDLPAEFFNSFIDLVGIQMGLRPFGNPVGDPSAQVSLEGSGIELTQAIQNSQNTLPLVASKTTVARVYADVNGVTSPEPVRVYLHGFRDGNELEGSPLAAFHFAPLTIDRTVLSHTANFKIPNSWTGGFVTFTAAVEGAFMHQTPTADVSVTFTPKAVPTYWVVPLNNATAANPNLPSDAEISRQESYLKTVFPVSDVKFIRKSWEEVGVTNATTAITDLNRYHTVNLIAWSLTVVSGKVPFPFPDQIYGVLRDGRGLSDPFWFNGQGKVGWGGAAASQVALMAHEINHNLDTSIPGTWGRHVSNPANNTDPNWGCGAAGPDLMWPPGGNDNIREVGFDTRGTYVVARPATDDFMSYCSSNTLPTNWISTYRWIQLFNAIPNAPVSALAASDLDSAVLKQVFYISGHVNADGTGNLDPLLVQPGTPTERFSDGEYFVNLLDGEDEVLISLPFFASFVDLEGEERETVPFNLIVPAFADTVRIELTKNDTVLDEVTVSDSAPEVKLLSPNGGERWQGYETIEWEGSDPDADALTFTLLYSPDGGSSWLAVASELTGDSYTFDTSILPGGEQARVLVIATDGFNNSEDDSDDVFSLATRGPDVRIISPSQEAKFTTIDSILLEGDAFDLEDGDSLPDDAFVWSLGDAAIGTGRTISAVLPEGRHTLSLTAVDSQGDIGEASVRIEVELTDAFNPCAFATIVGTARDDELVGTPGNDIIDSRGGDDSVDGLGGDDIICGGPGDDFLEGGEGDDLIFGESGSDEIHGGSGKDELRGASGLDMLFGGPGTDLLRGGPDDDLLEGGAGMDFLFGFTGDDFLKGDDANDKLHGGRGNDLLEGGADDDLLVGQGGDDRLDGELGADKLFGDFQHGGSGDDTLVATDGKVDNDTLNGGKGNDVCISDPDPQENCEFDE